jgi:hypothetical protein
MFCDLDDAPEFYDLTEPVARKEHRCCECDAPILKGEKHVVATGKWHGEISTFRQHLLCADACRFIRDKLQDGECICFGGLREWHVESRWDYDRTRPHESWRQIRGMLAGIKRRERAARLSAPPAGGAA